jgi:transposase
MISLTLTAEQRSAVQALRHDRTLRPAERDRVEMVLLSADGWSPPRTGRYLDCHPATVRQTLKRFTTDGVAALRWRQPGPPKDTARRQQVCGTLDRLLGAERTWTAAQLADALRAEGIALSTRQTRKYLRLLGARWRRTVTTLKHKQDPARVAQAGRVLANLKKVPSRPAPPGVPRRVRLQSQSAGDLQLGPTWGAQAHPVRETRNGGGSTSWPPPSSGPTRPTCAGWRSADPSMRSTWSTAWSSSLTRTSRPWWSSITPASTMLGWFVKRCPSSSASGCTCITCRCTARSWTPLYSPELNAIERLFRVIKHHELPERSYRTFDALQEAVHDAFTRYEATHCHQPAYHPRLAA